MLSRFVNLGIDEVTLELIGPLPTGRGVLGVVTDDAKPLRMDGDPGRQTLDPPRSA